MAAAAPTIKTHDITSDYSTYIFNYKKDEINNFAILGKWSKPFSTDIIDKSKIYHFVFLCDVSGSMAENLTNTSLSKLEIVKMSLLESLEIFKKLVNDGLKIGISVLSFNSFANVVFSSYEMKESDFESAKRKINFIYCSGSTNTEKGIDLVKIESQKIIDFNIRVYGDETKIMLNRILLSDGYHNGGIPKDELISKNGAYFDRCIGIGSGSEYDAEFLSSLTKEEIVNGANSINQTMEYIVDSLFGPISKVALNIEHSFDSEFNCNIPIMDGKVKMDELYSYQLVYFTGKTENDFIDYKLKYHRTVDKMDIDKEYRIDLTDDSEYVVVDEINKLINLKSLLIELTDGDIDKIRDMLRIAEISKEKFLELFEIEKIEGKYEMISVMINYLTNYIESLQKLIESKERRDENEYTVQHRNIMLTLTTSRSPAACRGASATYSDSLRTADPSLSVPISDPFSTENPS